MQEEGWAERREIIAGKIEFEKIRQGVIQQKKLDRQDEADQDEEEFRFELDLNPDL